MSSSLSPGFGPATVAGGPLARAAMPGDAPLPDSHGAGLSTLGMNPVFHVTTYIEWRNNGRTHCCHRHVRDLPLADETGTSWEMREPSHIKCPGLPRASKR